MRKERRRQPARGPDDPPANLLCAINRHLLREPVRSPYGDVFERETIETWLRTLGSVCPITGRALRQEDLVPDDDVARLAMAFQLKAAVEKHRG